MSALPSIPLIEQRPLLRPRYLDGYTLADFITKNERELRGYYDVQCALADDGEILPRFEAWCAVQFDLACEFRARVAAEASESVTGAIRT